MKKFSLLFPLGLLTVVLISLSGCARDSRSDSLFSGYSKDGGSHYPNAPIIGSPAWLAWVDKRVDTRYANGLRPDPGTQEWYAIVDYEVFIRDFYNDHYPTGYYRRGGYRGYFSYSDVRTNSDGARYDGARSGQGGYRPSYDGYGSGIEGYRANYDERPGYRRGGGDDGRGRSGYFGPARFSARELNYKRRSYPLGSVEWKREVTIAILTGRVSPPPARSDPWDAPLAPTH